MTNVGNGERTLRVFLGVLLLGFYWTPWPWVAAIAIVPFFTGISGYCPIYRLFGISTCSPKSG